MTPILLLFAAFPAALLAPASPQAESSARAQGDASALQAALGEARALRARGEAAAARERLSRALGSSEPERNPELLRVIDQLALEAREADAPALALAAWERVLPIWSANAPPAERELLRVRLDHAAVLRQVGRLEEALANYQELLMLAERELEPQARERSLARHGRASCLLQLGRFELAREELATLDLEGCELAVLSACETAVGLERAGQGLASLRAALDAAGARSSITSLWKVDDAATRRLMEQLYQELWLEELPATEALWRAKRSLRELGHPPRDWAAWVLAQAP